MNVANPVCRVREPLRGGVAEKFFNLGTDEAPFGFQSELGYVGHRRQLLNQILVQRLGFIAGPFICRTLANIDRNTYSSGESSALGSNRRPVGLERQANVHEFHKARELFTSQCPACVFDDSGIITVEMKYGFPDVLPAPQA